MAGSQRIALVSGANRGLGFEIVRQLAAKGLTVILAARDQQHGTSAAEQLAAAGLPVLARQLDVTNQASVQTLARLIEREFGRLDVLVNNAAILIEDKEHPSSINLDIVKETLETNLFGAWRMCQAFIPLMRRHGYGRIVNLSSLEDAFHKIVDETWPAYGVSKVSLNLLTVMLAAELRGTNILVNAAHPGWVQTRMGGQAAPTSVQEGADTAVWLATLPDDGPTGDFFRQRRPIAW
jgi:NAD(P)-dependent dehydrogenase (short-subunit alcohol dehydrogenase family)